MAPLWRTGALPRRLRGPKIKENPGNSRALGDAGLGQFDRDPQIDLGQDLVEPIVARGVMEIGGHRL